MGNFSSKEASIKQFCFTEFICWSDHAVGLVEWSPGVAVLDVDADDARWVDRNGLGPRPVKREGESEVELMCFLWGVDFDRLQRIATRQACRCGDTGGVEVVHGDVIEARHESNGVVERALVLALDLEGNGRVLFRDSFQKRVPGKCRIHRLPLRNEVEGHGGSSPRYHKGRNRGHRSAAGAGDHDGVPPRGVEDGVVRIAGKLSDSTGRREVSGLNGKAAFVSHFDRDDFSSEIEIQSAAARLFFQDCQRSSDTCRSPVVVPLCRCSARHDDGCAA
mmetsp:Transcript_16833/g.36209  ORF Transcript_16833/g.36209 Transcript_16833/m.36209 type:complete len:277 (+) Transcript_16833:1585-2415(+)